MKCTNYKFYDWENFDFKSLLRRIEHEEHRRKASLSDKVTEIRFKSPSGRKIEEIDRDFLEHLDHQAKLCILLTKSFNAWADLWPKFLAGKATHTEYQKMMDDSQQNYSYTWGHYLRDLVTGRCEYGNWNAQEIYKEELQKQLKFYGVYDIWKKDNDIINSMAFLTEQDGFDYVFSNFDHVFFGTEYDQYYRLAEALPEVQTKYEDAFKRIAREVAEIPNPKQIKEYFEKIPYIYREIFPPCDEDDSESGVYILRQIKGYRDHLEAFDPIDFYVRMSQFYLIPFLKKAEDHMKHSPEFSEYYQPKVDVFDKFLHTFLDFVLDYCKDVFPLFVEQRRADSAYTSLVEINDLPEDLLDRIKAEKMWFEHVGEQSAARQEQFDNETSNNESVAAVEKIKKEYEGYKKKAEKALKKKDSSEFSVPYSNMKGLIEDLEKIDVPESHEFQEVLKEELAKFKKDKRELKMHDYYMSYKDAFSMADDVNNALSTDNSMMVNALLPALKSQKESFLEDLESFDYPEIKEYPPIVALLQKVDDVIARASSGAKSPEVTNAEMTLIPQLDAFLPSLTMMTTMPPNPMMVPNLMMIKAQVMTPLAQLKPLAGQSPKIKAAVDRAEAMLIPFDAYIAKCSAPQ